MNNTPFFCEQVVNISTLTVQVLRQRRTMRQEQLPQAHGAVLS